MANTGPQRRFPKKPWISVSTNTFSLWNWVYSDCWTCNNGIKLEKEWQITENLIDLADFSYMRIAKSVNIIKHALQSFQINTPIKKFNTCKWSNGDLRKWGKESVRTVITLLHASASPLHPLSQSKVFHICPTALQHWVMKRNPFPLLLPLSLRPV